MKYIILFSQALCVMTFFYFPTASAGICGDLIAKLGFHLNKKADEDPSKQAGYAVSGKKPFTYVVNSLSRGEALNYGLLKGWSNGLAEVKGKALSPLIDRWNLLSPDGRVLVSTDSTHITLGDNQSKIGVRIRHLNQSEYETGPESVFNLLWDNDSKGFFAVSARGARYFDLSDFLEDSTAMVHMSENVQALPGGRSTNLKTVKISDGKYFMTTYASEDNGFPRRFHRIVDVARATEGKGATFRQTPLDDQFKYLGDLKGVPPFGWLWGESPLNSSAHFVTPTSDGNYLVVTAQGTAGHPWVAVIQIGQTVDNIKSETPKVVYAEEIKTIKVENFDNIQDSNRSLGTFEIRIIGTDVKESGNGVMQITLKYGEFRDGGTHDDELYREWTEVVKVLID